MHLAYESQNDLKNTQLRSKDYENLIAQLRLHIDHKLKVESELLTRIEQLSTENARLQRLLNNVNDKKQNSEKHD